MASVSKPFSSNLNLLGPRLLATMFLERDTFVNDDKTGRILVDFLGKLSDQSD